MDPITIALLASSIGQVGLGVYQGIKANKMEKDLVRPTYETPEQINEITNIARRLYGSDMPGMDAMEQRTKSSTAEALKTAKDVGTPSNILGSLASVYGSEMKSLEDLGIANAEYSTQMADKLKSALSVEAGYADKEFEYNEADPYSEKAAAISALKEAAIKNVFGGAQNVGSGVYQDDINKKLLESYEGRTASMDKYMEMLLGGNTNIATEQAAQDKEFEEMPWLNENPDGTYSPDLYKMLIG